MKSINAPENKSLKIRNTEKLNIRWNGILPSLSEKVNCVEWEEIEWIYSVEFVKFHCSVFLISMFLCRCFELHRQNDIINVQLDFILQINFPNFIVRFVLFYLFVSTSHPPFNVNSYVIAHWTFIYKASTNGCRLCLKKDRLFLKYFSLNAKRQIKNFQIINQNIT